MSQVRVIDRNQDRILFHLKTRGPRTASEIGRRFGMTAAGARQHLLKLQATGLVEAEDLRRGRGRPKKTWHLTQQGHGRFPDRHSDLALDLLKSTRKIFGDRGLEKLIAYRERASLAAYRKTVERRRSLHEKLIALAEVRSQEGYMASVEQDRHGHFLLIENHCPICAAAATCQGLCRSELAIFRAVLGRDVTVERVDHILAGARRCAYRISPPGSASVNDLTGGLPASSAVPPPARRRGRRD